VSEDAAARANDPAISEPLTWEEICRRYPDQWVVLVEMDWIEDVDELRTARVAGHGPRRKDPLVQARPLRERHREMGHFFTGRVRASALDTFAP
jgi:hypothetical protein